MGSGAYWGHGAGGHHDHYHLRTEPADWQWIGPHMSQRMFGITRRRAQEYATRFGGTASPLEPFVRGLGTVIYEE